MWKIPIICLMMGLVSCTGASNKSDNSVADKATDSEIAVINITGQWDIENVVENDSFYIRPSEIEQGINAYIDFREDNSFGVMTNCNHIGGRYHQANDSILLTDISSTEIACDNMDLEEMLKKILPMVNTVDCINDSITRLNSDKGDSYIVLRKNSSAVK